jgi:hypothetical protein
MNAYAPALFVDIQTDEDRLTRKIKFVTVTHGKSPFGRFFSYPGKNYNRKFETCLSFFKHKIWRTPDRVRGRRRNPGENRDPVLEMVPDFHRDDVWTPVSTGVTTFYDIIIIGILASRLFKFKFEKTRSKIENRFATFTVLG